MLGALEIRAEDGRDVGVGGARLRALLILLALEPGRVVSSELLIDGIWEQDPRRPPPTRSRPWCHGCGGRCPGWTSNPIRRGTGCWSAPRTWTWSASSGWPPRGTPPWPGATPARRRGCCGRHSRCGAGRPLLDVAGSDSFRPPVTRLAELRTAALEDRIEADLRMGRGRELTGELSSLVAEHPCANGSSGR